MATQLLVLGHDCDYYGVSTNSDCVAVAVRMVFDGPQQICHGAAFLQNVADCSIVIPADRLCPYGASFLKCVAANPGVTLVDQLLRLFNELMVEGDGHHVDYVLVHSLEILEHPHIGCGLLAWVQMLISDTRPLRNSTRAPKDCTRLSGKG